MGGSGRHQAVMHALVRCMAYRPTCNVANPAAGASSYGDEDMGLHQAGHDAAEQQHNIALRHCVCCAPRPSCTAAV